MNTLPLSLEATDREDGTARVECLGQTFESDQARREHYLALLAAKLKDPEFRNTPGFPEGTDEAILRMSDPPYYTACPNPFLKMFAEQSEPANDPAEEYHREPFAVDVSEGKIDPLYRTHIYHTRVPHNVRKLSLFVQDEASATQWVRQQLHVKPRTFQNPKPQLLQQIQAWVQHNKTVALKEIFDLNFLIYDGEGPVPSQVHSYLSTNYKQLRRRGKNDELLKAEAFDRWYVPDPRKEGDLQRLRTKSMLREFDEYRASTRPRIRQFRTEAVRVGFKHCYDMQDYRTIVDVARKLPEQVVQEDEKLLMYYDVATMRLGDTEED